MDTIETANSQVHRASVIAGLGILLLAILAGISHFVVLENLVTHGDATQTANSIVNSENMFRLGIASLLLVAVLDVVVAWALFTVFEPVSRSVSLLAAWFRALYATIFVVAISQLIGVLHLLNTAEYLTVYTTEQLHTQALLGITSFTDLWSAGLILFGVHLLLLGYLAYVSEYVPRLLGVLLVVAGLGYVIDSFGLVLSSAYTIELAAFTFIGEVALIFWLLIKGRRIEVDRTSVSTAT